MPLQLDRDEGVARKQQRAVLDFTTIDPSPLPEPRNVDREPGEPEKVLRHALAAGGIHFNEHLDGDGAVIFDHACRLGLEGIVSKRRDLPYRSGRSKCWVKIKNPTSPAMMRVEEGTW